jgi:hypothetical protein
MSDNNFNRGDWISWGDHIGVIHGATKGGRYLIEYESLTASHYVERKWVRYEYLTKLDPAVSSLLNSIYQAV